MKPLSRLYPAPIWRYFEEICHIPRISKNEGKIRDYLLDFSKRNNLEGKRDDVGNVLIVRPASKGFENRKTLVLQSHMDMVGEKNADHVHDWANDPIIPVVGDEWVTASGTTLGADDGIGIASQLAILTDKNLKAGKIECLFTVDEESGMTGSTNMKPGFFEGRILLNLDSEDEGILFIGSAGGMDTVGSLKSESIPVPGNSVAYEISITGLHGGHSGDEIHKGYGNSIKMMNRILQDLTNQYDICLNKYNGGSLRNAIPREAYAVITVNRSLKESLRSFVTDYQELFAEEFCKTENSIRITINETATPSSVIDKGTQSKLLGSITSCPHGVIDWSKDMEDLVETSTNLAIIRFSEDNIINIITTQRSSVESSLSKVAGAVESCLKLAGAEVVHSDGYPGWEPNLQSEILKIAKGSYLHLFGKEPEVRAIHAGLECGLIFKKYKGIDIISFGPTIKGAHTPEEKIEIRSVQMFWNLLLDIIHNTPYNR